MRSAPPVLRALLQSDVFVLPCLVRYSMDQAGSLKGQPVGHVATITWSLLDQQPVMRAVVSAPRLLAPCGGGTRGAHQLVDLAGEETR